MIYINLFINYKDTVGKRDIGIIENMDYRQYNNRIVYIDAKVTCILNNINITKKIFQNYGYTLISEKYSNLSGTFYFSKRIDCYNHIKYPNAKLPDLSNEFCLFIRTLYSYNFKRDKIILKNNDCIEFIIYN
jgi:hypothetical protein